MKELTKSFLANFSKTQQILIMYK